MKKFYSFLFAAVALVGFAACNSDSTEDQPTPAGVEKVSFKANIDTTKTDLNGLQTVWCEGDEVVVDEKYTFICEDDLTTFTCTQTGCSELLEKESVTAVYNKEIDSTTGTAGAKLVGEGNLKNGISFQIESAFLKFTTTGAVTLKGTIGLFSAESVTIAEAGEHYVAINPGEATLSYEIEGYKCKEVTMEFAAGMIYKLGEFTPAKAHEMFGIVGAHQGWNSAAPDALYQIPNSNTYVRYNVTLAEGGFKFYGSKTEKVTIEHPAVTTGEEGYLFLQPSTNWKADGARFAAYFFGNGDTWVSMEDTNKDGIYVVKDKPQKDYPNVIFCRMNPSTTANNWNNRWNQTDDLTIPKDDKNCYAVKEGTWDKGGGTWSVHTPEKKAWTEDVDKVTEYWFGNDAYGGDYKTGWAIGWNNAGVDITVDDTTKTYDIYFNQEEDAVQDCGFKINYTVLEHGSPAPELK